MSALPTPGMMWAFERALQKDVIIRRLLKQKKYRQHFEARIKRGRGNACDLWTGALDSDGYGIWHPFLNGTQHHFKAHRVELIRKGAKFTINEVSCHTCRNRHCVKHVKPGPVVQNIQDKIRDGTIVLPDTKGSSNGYSKLSETQVHCIRWLHDNYPEIYTMKELGDIFGVSRLNISMIVRRVTWKHI